jgi:HNH endonuclease
MTADEVREWLDYDPDTGEFRWKKVRCGRGANQMRVGDLAGTYQQGYLRICVNGRIYRAHRLAWLLHCGEFPNGFLDYIDGNKRNNRIANLRVATNSENQANRGPPIRKTSGAKGVTWKQGKWHAQIAIEGRQKFLGAFHDKEVVIAARNVGEAKYQGEYARRGK